MKADMTKRQMDLLIEKQCEQTDTCSTFTCTVELQWLEHLWDHEN